MSGSRLLIPVFVASALVGVLFAKVQSLDQRSQGRSRTCVIESIQQQEAIDALSKRVAALSVQVQSIKPCQCPAHSQGSPAAKVGPVKSAPVTKAQAATQKQQPKGYWATRCVNGRCYRVWVAQ